MLHRNKTACYLFVVLISCLSASSVSGGENPVIKFYQEHISAVDGDRCPMYPTCSSYAKKAIEKHGAVVGWVMALDRLIRCGRDESNLSPSYVINDQTVIYDPVEANDFWWFNK